MITLIVTIILCVGIFYYLASLVATYVKLSSALDPRDEPARAAASFSPPVSILKPLKGTDGNLYDNLLSFVNQDYPHFEILFGLNSNDSAVPIVKQIQQESPGKDIRIIIHDEVIGYNPKINNLAGIVPQAKYEYLVISDSNVRVAPDYLSKNMRHFQEEEVGLITNLIRGVGGRNLGATLENLHLNSFVIANMNLLDVFFGLKAVVGKSMFFRKSQFVQLDVLRELKNYLAEDYLMGKLFEKNGYKIIISPYLVDNITYSWSQKQFFNRHTRWAKVRWNLNRTAYIGEILANFSFWALVLSLLQDSLSLFFLALLPPWAIKISGDLLINYWLRRPIKWYAFPLAPIKDLLVACIWPVPILYSRTKWRGNKLKVTKDSLLLPVN
jgi:ceramide glucosyltransferase